jgi:hypothetical protein
MYTEQSFHATDFLYIKSVHMLYGTKYYVVVCETLGKDLVFVCCKAVNR